MEQIEQSELQELASRYFWGEITLSEALQSALQSFDEETLKKFIKLISEQ